MELTKKEKQILTLIDDSKVYNFIELAQKHVKISKEEIEKIVEKFLKLKLINKVELKKGEFWYFHDKSKVTKDMRDDDLYYKLNFQS